MTPSRPASGSVPKPRPRNVTPTTPTPVYPIPPLAAVFMTHFHDTKGQEVVQYISNDDIKLGKGTIEHTTLPSGLHLLDQDFFGFRHGSRSTSDLDSRNVNGRKGDGDGDGDGNGKGDGTWPGVALFRSRQVEVEGGSGKGRGRRMVSIGCILANPEQGHEIFELKPWLDELYDFLEFSPPMEGAMESLSNSHSNSEREVDDRLIKILEGLWGSYGCKTPPSIWRDGQVQCHSHGQSQGQGQGQRGDQEGKKRVEGGLRNLANGQEVSEHHPIRYLPKLVELLGPSIITVYKAAISGRKILIYAPPPLFPMSAFGYLIAVLSLSPSSVERGMTQWVGQVGLMDLTALYARQGAWIASTSDKILLSHTKLYDLSIDLSSCNPLPTPDSDPKSESESITEPTPTQIEGQATIQYTTPTSPTPIPASYTFSDIPLYRLISISTPSTISNADWWLTFYDLFDKVYTICAGVCEYAVGRGQVGAGSISLHNQDEQLGQGVGEEDYLLQHEYHDEDEDDENVGGDEGEDEEGQEMRRRGVEEQRRGQSILRQFYHHSFHLYALLEAVVVPGQSITMGQVRELTGKWLVTKEDYIFWSDLARHWENFTGGGDTS